jgi:hypothetical protein
VYHSWIYQLKRALPRTSLDSLVVAALSNTLASSADDRQSSLMKGQGFTERALRPLRVATLRTRSKQQDSKNIAKIGFEYFEVGFRQIV